MAFLSDIFGRVGRVARGQAKPVSMPSKTRLSRRRSQTVADMKTELNKVVQASAMAMSNYNRLDAEYQKYVRQSDEWKARAGQALDAGNEDLAKKALGKKAECDKQVASMKTSVDQARGHQREAQAAGRRARSARSMKAIAPPPRWWRARTPLWRSARSARPWPAWATPTTLFPSSTVSKNRSPRKKPPPRLSTSLLRPARMTISKLSSQRSAVRGVDAELAALKAERQKANLPPPPYIPKELAGPGGTLTTDTKAKEKAGA